MRDAEQHLSYAESAQERADDAYRIGDSGHDDTTFELMEAQNHALISIAKSLIAINNAKQGEGR